MRLIDADALEKELCSTCGACDIEKSHINCQVVEIIKDMPTIESEPVVYAEWRTGTGILKFACSECSVACSNKTNFCPHCGADMRGTHNETNT